MSAAVTFSVTRGPNKGAHARLCARKAVVIGGGRTAADIVLDEPCAAERHLQVEVLCDGWSVRVLPLEPGLRLVGRRPWPRTRQLAPGRPVRLLPLVSDVADAQFACGDTLMRLALPGIAALVQSTLRRGVARVREPWARRPRVLAAASAGAVALLTAASVYSWSHAGRADDGARPPPPGAAREPSPPPCASARACAEAVAQALRDRLVAAGPAYRVEPMPPDGAGSVAVRVTLPDDGQPSGHDIRRWFDGLPQSQFGVRLEVDRVARAANGPPALAIAAFSPGPGGQVMLQGGQVFQEGSGLDGGWRLEAVARDRIVLAHRDGRRHEIAGLAPPEEAPAQLAPEPVSGGAGPGGAFPPAPPSLQQRDDAAPRGGRQGQGGRRARGGVAVRWTIER